MSYASAAANAPDTTDPLPDPALLNTAPPTASPVADDSAKVNVVPNDFKEHPATITSESRPFFEDDGSAPSDSNKKGNRRLKEAQAEGAYLWEAAKHYLLRPGVAGGLVGIVNIGLLAGATRAFYTQPHLRHDTKIISATAAATLAFLFAEGYATEKYHETPRGKAELSRAKEEGTLLYRHAQEIVLRPGVLGGLVGLLNAGILGAIGYFSYTNWDRPTWDRRIVSAVSVGLFTLWGGEGVLAERYRESRK